MPTRASSKAPVHRHPMRVVTRRTGLSADLLRVWEKRYDVVKPGRSSGGRRLYSDADIERLRLLYRATLAGRGIGQVAALSTPALVALVRRDADAERADTVGRVPSAVTGAAAPVTADGTRPTVSARSASASRRTSATSAGVDNAATCPMPRPASVAR